MMTRLMAWLRRLFAPAPRPYLTATSTVRPLDVEVVREKWQPEEAGRGDGLRGFPSEDATASGGWESDFRQWCVSELRRVHQDISDAIESSIRSIRQLDAANGADRVRKIQVECDADLKVAQRTQQNAVHSAASAARDAEERLRGFREAHQRSYLPVRRISPLLSWAILLVMFVIESAVNGLMFAGGSDFGIVGGVLRAAMFAAFNIALGAAAGWIAVRQLWHTHVGRRILGGLATSAAFIGALGLNIAIAHFRDASIMGLAENEAAQQALARIESAPFHFTDIFSWLLFGMGMAFWLIACVDAFKMDDPYPGYGPVSRASEAALEAYQEAIEGATAELTGIKQRAVDVINRLAEGESHYVSKRQGRQSQIASMRTGYLDHVETVENTFRRFASEYRRANKAARQGGTPTYFDVVPDRLGALNLDVAELPPPRHGLSAAAVDAVLAISTEYERIVLALPALADLQPRERDDP